MTEPRRNDDEARLRDAMRALAREDARVAPPFERTWARARAPRAAIARRAAVVVVAAAALIGVAIVARPPAPLEHMPAPSRDREPLRALLDVPRSSVLARGEEWDR